LYKVIIADDENKVRQAIRMMVDWDRLGLSGEEAANGNALLELAACVRPQIVVTDLRMPGLSGAELLQALRDLDEYLQVIVISGYDDYTYMKQAIVTRTVDYLLKPISKAQLNEALSKAILEFEKRQRVRVRDESAKLVLRDKILARVVEGQTFNHDEFHYLTDTLPGQAAYTVAVIHIANYSRISKRFADDQSLMAFALSNLIAETVKPLGTVFEQNGKQREWVVLIHKGAPADDEKRLLGEVIRRLHEYLRVQAYIGVGGAYTSEEAISASYREAKLALEQSQFNTSHAIADYRELNLSESKTGEGDRQKFTLLGEAVERGQLTYIREFIEKWHEAHEGVLIVNLGHIQSSAKRIWSELERLTDHAAETDKEALLKLAMQTREALREELQPDAIRDTLLAYVEQAGNLLVDRTQLEADYSVIYEIRTFIGERLHEKITLQDLADKFYLSKESISRSYKKIFGINLFDHVLQLKIDRAKLMLNDARIKVREISDELGFTDESHFSKTFKKYTGFSPRAYRSGRAQNPHVTEE